MPHLSFFEIVIPQIHLFDQTVSLNNHMSMMATREEQEEEEEGGALPLISNAKVIEYLVPAMSEELLCKFSHNPASDFDYSQSSIWSPLVPRRYGYSLNPDWSAAALPDDRGLTYWAGSPMEEDGNQGGRRSGKRKIGNCGGFGVKLGSAKWKKKKKRRSIAPAKAEANDGGCVPFARTGWNKVLKAASKHFKNKRKNSRVIRVKLSAQILTS